VTVLLDRRAQAHRGVGAEASLEFAIELVASVCRHLLDGGRRVTLVAENSVTLAPGATRRSSSTCWPPSTVHAPRSGAAASDGGELFAVLGSVDPAAVAPLIEAPERHGHAVLLDVAAWTSAQKPPGHGVAAGPGHSPTPGGACWWAGQIASGQGVERLLPPAAGAAGTGR